jgi:Putative Actinobacterial Holin-X, holin superfamily III
MSTTAQNIESVFDDIKEYLDARKELMKLQVIEKTTTIAAGTVSLLIIIPFFVLAFFFVSITLAHVFAELWGHEYAGYLTVTILYTLTGLLLVKYRRRWLLNPIKNKLIQQILSKDHHD